MAVFNSQSVRRNNPATMESQTADRDYYIDKEGNLVDEGDANAAFLVAAKGSPVAKDVAEKYGIVIEESAPAETDEGGEKATKASTNKAASPAKNKGAKK
jgi:hypothetical protein